MKRLVMVAVGLVFGPTLVGAQDSATADSFVAIRVTDADAAAQWYSRVFRLNEVNRIEGDDYSIRILTSSGLAVELITQTGDDVPEGRHLGLFKSGIFVRDIDAFFARMREQGVDTDRAIFTDPALQMRSFVMRDLEGNRLQIFQRCDLACG